MGCQFTQNDRVYINAKRVVLYHAPDSLLVFYPNVPFNIIFIKSLRPMPFAPIAIS